MAYSTRFLLNDQEIESTASPGLLVLDYLRQHRQLTGTKEGCKEGDCGACVVLIGTLEGKKLSYQPITSCLMPLGELQGKHLVTIEGLNLDVLNPVQASIVNNGATQCGFCTPGIVVSLTGLIMTDKTVIDKQSVNKALSGHLCRCTGYRSLKQATSDLQATLTGTGIKSLVEQGALPQWFSTIKRRLRKLHKSLPSAGGMATDNGKPQMILAGGTDLYVQQGESIPELSLDILDSHSDLRGIEEQDGFISVGALTSFEEFANHRLISNMIPNIEHYMQLNASWQIRNRATLGGNLINASPIADMTIPLLALKAELLLTSAKQERLVPLIQFYKGYKTFDKRPNEILAKIRIPQFSGDTRFHFEKASRRKHLDIATVNSAVCIRISENIIEDIGLAVGGVAPIPLFLHDTCRFLIGKAIQPQLISEALSLLQQEIAPISDIRGSAEYKRLLARQFFIAQFATLFPDMINVRDFYEA